MKKIIVKRNRKHKVYPWKKRISKAASTAACVALLMGMCQAPALAAEPVIETGALPVTEEKSQVVLEELERGAGEGNVSVDIYHKHSGNEGEEGGCYKEAVYHEHTGSETEGGMCYETPVYHVHEGDAAAGGGCFNEVVYHAHEGNETEGGGCYSEVYHTHTSSCKKEKECTISFTVVVSAYETYYDTCSHHGEGVFCRSKVKAKHSSCGSGTVDTTTTYCLYCGVNPIRHTYKATTCGISTDVAMGYELSCGKSDTTPEYYETDCGKDETTVESYALSCEKTEQFIEGYRVNCGFSEDMPVARLNITNETAGSEQKVVLQVELADFSEGKLDFSGSSFRWYDENGNLISQGEKAEVTGNGNYYVEFVPDSAMENLTHAKGSISVGNVYIPTPAPTPKKTEKPKEDDPKEKDDTDHKDDAGEVSPTEEDDGDDSETEEVIVSPTPSVTPTIRPTEKPKEKSDKKEKVSEEKKGKTHLSEAANSSPSPVPSKTPEQTPAKTPERIMQTGEDLDKGEAGNQVLGEERKEASGKWFRKIAEWVRQPAGAVITITAGTLLLSGLLYFLLFILRKSVVLYNDDGNGRMMRLGRCMVANEGEDFSITISQSMEEKSCTNRYCIKPGLFRVGRSKEQMLFVCKGKKRISVYLSKEMIVVI